MSARGRTGHPPHTSCAAYARIVSACTPLIWLAKLRNAGVALNALMPRELKMHICRFGRSQLRDCRLEPCTFGMFQHREAK